MKRMVASAFLLSLLATGCAKGKPVPWTSVTSSADGTKLVAVGDGHIHTSADSGATWTTSGPWGYWTSVASSADGNKLVAVSNGALASEDHGNILVSTDSGISWTPTSSVQSNWVSLASSADGNKLVVFGKDNQGRSSVYTSTDSGVAWTQVREDLGDWALVASSADGTKLVAGVKGGPIYTSVDSGTTWNQEPASSPGSSSENWTSVASSADGSKLVAVVAGGPIYTSADSGGTWRQEGTSNSWTSVASSADGTNLVAVAQGGFIYTSTNSGAAWTQRCVSDNWTSVASSADGARLVAITSAGHIYTSTSSGVTWTKAGAGQPDVTQVGSDGAAGSVDVRTGGVIGADGADTPGSDTPSHVADSGSNGSGGTVAVGGTTADGGAGGGGARGSGGADAAVGRFFAISGAVSGLSGTGMVITDNDNGHTLTVNSNGPFTLSTNVPDGQSYDVQLSPPTAPQQVCSVANGTGQIGGANVTNVTVTCPPFVVVTGCLNGGAGNAMATDGVNLYYGQGLPAGGSANDPTGANSPSTDALMRVPVDGSALPIMMSWADHYAGNAGISGIALDATYVYWTSYADATVRMLPLLAAGSTPPPPIANGGQYGKDIVVDAASTNLYWYEYGGGYIYQTAISTGGFSQFTGYQGYWYTVNLAIDANNLYFTDFDNQSAAGAATVNMKTLTPPYTQTRIASNQMGAILPRASASTIYWLNTGSLTNSYADGAVMQSPIASPKPTPLATPIQQPNGIAVDPTNVYVASFGSSASNYVDGKILEIPLAGGLPIVIAQGLHQPSNVIVDAEHVYWLNAPKTPGNSDGTIMRVRK